MSEVSSATALNWIDMLEALTALRRGDFTQELPPQPAGTPEAAVVQAYHELAQQLDTLTTELRRVVREIGVDSHLGCQAEVPELDGRWRELHDDVNQMAEVLTLQIRQLGKTTQALATGAAAPPLPQNARGEMQGVQVSVNQLVERIQGPTAP